MSKRVTFVTPELDPLGNAGQLPFWSEVLQTAGWQVSVISLQDHPESQYAVRYPGVELDCLGLRPREWGRWRNLKSLIDARRGDVLHFWGCSNQCGWWLGQRAQQLLSTSFHRKPRRTVARRCYRQPELAVVFDPQLSAAADARRPAGTDSSALLQSVHLIPKAIPRLLERRRSTRERLRKELCLPADVKLIVAAAALEPRTHCKDLIWGIDQLKIIRDDIHLLLLGRGGQRRQLERFLSLTEAESRTHFLGARPDGPEIVAAADIFWQADLSVYLPEGLLLALASGVPVVSAYGPSTSAVVRPQQTAWVADPAARYHYARWSKFFLEESARAAQLATQAKALVERDFSAAEVSARIREIYR